MPRKTLFQRSSKNGSHFFWRIDLKGNFETAKLINDHSQRPNIALSPVTLLLVVPNLGTNIERRTSARFGHASLRNYFAHIQISQLEPFFFVSENIGRFYIPVGNLMLMQVFHCLCHIQQNFPHCLLWNSSPFLLGLLDQLRKVPSVRILQKNVKIVVLFVEKAIMELNNMRVVERGLWPHWEHWPIRTSWAQSRRSNYKTAYPFDSKQLGGFSFFQQKHLPVDTLPNTSQKIVLRESVLKLLGLETVPHKEYKIGRSILFSFSCR